MVFYGRKGEGADQGGKASITDTSVGVEELGHLEMVGTIVHQLTRNLTEEERRSNGFAQYFVDHSQGVYPQAAAGVPWSAAMMQVKGDPITDLAEDMAAEQKARTTYDNILRLSDDPDVNDVIKFLRERVCSKHFFIFGLFFLSYCAKIFAELSLNTRFFMKKTPIESQSKKNAKKIKKSKNRYFQNQVYMLLL